MRVRPVRWVVVLGVIVTALGVLSYQAYASFTASVNRTITVGAATMHLEFGGVDRMSIDATDLQPGDEALRAVDLDVVGTPQMSSASVTTVATTSSQLDTDATNGLQLSIDRCDHAWNETLDGGGVPISYTCPGVTSTPVGAGPVIVSNEGLALDLTPGAANHLLIRLKLPDTADGSFAGLSSTIQFTFRGEQPAGGTPR